MEKIGIMGGTFNPIHNGHLASAVEVSRQLGLDKIIFIPAGRPAFKDNGQTASAFHRYAMCALAIQPHPQFCISPIEVEKSGISYTFETLQKLKVMHPLCKFFFIAGADIIKNFHKWRNSDEILKICQMVITSRPGSPLVLEGSLKSAIQISIADIDISSTMVRESLSSGKPIDTFVPVSVADYIKVQGLYSHIWTITNRLKGAQSVRLYDHSVSVAATALMYGKHHGLDDVILNKLHIAGLLHDCAKEYCNWLSVTQLESLFVENGLDAADVFLRENIPLAHGFVGAIIARRDYKILDSDILEAIKCHTFGRVGMTLIDKLLFVADYTEPLRPQSIDISMAATIAMEDLDKAVMHILKAKIEKNRAKGRQIYSQTLNALKDLEEKNAIK